MPAEVAVYPGGVAVVTGAPLKILVKALEQQVAGARRNGIAVHQRVVDLLGELQEAVRESSALAAERVAAVVEERASAETVSVAEAAKLLGVSERQVRRRVEEFGGFREGRGATAPWRLDRDLVLASRPAMRPTCPVSAVWSG